MQNVREFGAAGNGVIRDTRAVQDAIDAGGMVVFPPGTYLCGTLYLRSGGGLYLEPGAKILASPDPADYNADDFIPQNRASKKERCSGAHLIVAVGQENIVISGFGVIDGNAETIFSGMTHNPEDKNYYHIPPWRAAQMLFFCECSSVTVENVRLRGATYWNCFFHGCSEVIVRGLDIRSSHFVRNTDGIDIDCCRNVCVSDCLIDTGDDGITLRGHAEPLLRKQVCENVSVSNCVISSTCSGVRIGVGDGTIRNCMLSNLVMYDTTCGITFCSSYSRNYVDISGISFENLHFDGVRFMLLMNNWLGNYDEPCPLMHGLCFRNLHVRCSQPSFLTGNIGARIADVVFQNMDLEVTGSYRCPAELENASLYDRLWARSGTGVFIISEIADLLFRNVRFQWGAESGLRYALETSAVPGLRMIDCAFNRDCLSK